MCLVLSRAGDAIWLLFHYYYYWQSFFFPNLVIIIALAMPNAGRAYSCSVDWAVSSCAQLFTCDIGDVIVGRSLCGNKFTTDWPGMRTTPALTTDFKWQTEKIEWKLIRVIKICSWCWSTCRSQMLWCQMRGRDDFLLYTNDMSIDCAFIVHCHCHQFVINFIHWSIRCGNLLLLLKIRDYSHFNWYEWIACNSNISHFRNEFFVNVDSSQKGVGAQTFVVIVDQHWRVIHGRESESWQSNLS